MTSVRIKSNYILYDSMKWIDLAYENRIASIFGL
jgi:hypothetical protein